MALANYTDLVSAVGSYMRRGGSSDFTSQIPNFIALFEAWANRNLAAKEQHISTTIAITSGSGTIPTDWVEFESVSYVSSPDIPLTYLSPDALNAVYPSSDAGYPEFYTIKGPTVSVRPVATGSLDVLYQARVPALTSVATTNWLMTGSPDAYLFGCLAEANAYIEEVDKAGLWLSRAQSAIDQIVATGFRRFAQGQQMVVDRPTP